MKKTLKLIMPALLVSALAQGQCIPSPANIYSFAFNQSRYEIVKEKLNWRDAAACAVSRGGKLAEIEDQNEQNAIFQSVNNAGILAANTVAPDGANASYLWIGGNDLLTEGKWVWDGANSGSSVQFWQGTKTGNAVGGRYNNWGNEPDNWTSQNGLGFAFTDWPLGLAGQWNDIKEANALYYIVEFPKSTSVAETKPEVAIVYPNPVTDLITIAITDRTVAGNYEAYLSNLTGQLILKTAISKQQSSVNVSALLPGCYILTIKDGMGQQVLSQKIIKE